MPSLKFRCVMALCRWVFKQLYDKGLVYRGVKVMPFSTACNTPLSNFESHQNYKVGAERRSRGDAPNATTSAIFLPFLSSRTSKIHPSLLTSHWWTTKTWPWSPGQPHPGHCPATWPSVSTQRCCMSRSKVRSKTCYSCVMDLDYEQSGMQNQMFADWDALIWFF